MAYDEQEAKRSRVVVETPNERREVTHSQSVRTPDESGISAGMVGVLVVVAIALITMLVLFYMNSQQQPTDQTLATQPQQPAPTTVVQQPAQQPPVIIQQPAPATQPAPIVVTPPAGGTTATESAPNIDSTVQAAIDKTLTDDPTFTNVGLTATVLDGKVTLLGTVKTQDLKNQAERLVKRIKGVKSVDNQILVVAE